MKFIVLFDACVLYPAPLRDFLLRLAGLKLFAAKWTEKIHDEWISNLLQKRPELEKPLKRTRKLINDSVPDCLVSGYEPLIPGLNLPDKDDRHVLAAAILCGAQIIVTFNNKDFPKKILETYGIEAVHPDEFVGHQMSLHQGQVIKAAKNHRASLTKPPKSEDEYLNTLSAQGLVISSDKLREFIDFI